MEGGGWQKIIMKCNSGEQLASGEKKKITYDLSFFPFV